MANYTYLIQSASAEPAECDPDKDVLVAAKYSIPIFWYALFDAGSIIAKRAGMEDGTTMPYAFLTTTTAAAKARFADRRRSLQELLPKSVASALDDFAKLLDSVEKSHIHLETIELWMMDKPETFQAHVEACLRAFELSGRGIVAAALTGTPEWQALLAQAGIDPGNIDGSVQPYMLTGGGWGRPVPWKE